MSKGTGSNTMPLMYSKPRSWFMACNEGYHIENYRSKIEWKFETQVYKTKMFPLSVSYTKQKKDTFNTTLWYFFFQTRSSPVPFKEKRKHYDTLRWRFLSVIVNRWLYLVLLCNSCQLFQDVLFKSFKFADFSKRILIAIGLCPLHCVFLVRIDYCN